MNYYIFEYPINGDLLIEEIQSIMTVLRGKFGNNVIAIPNSTSLKQCTLDELKQISDILNIFIKEQENANKN